MRLLLMSLAQCRQNTIGHQKLASYLKACFRKSFRWTIIGMVNSKETVQMSACFSDIISSESESIQETDFDQKHAHTFSLTYIIHRKTPNNHSKMCIFVSCLLLLSSFCWIKHELMALWNLVCSAHAVRIKAVDRASISK